MDFDKLDITMKYVGLQYGTSAIANRIVRYTKGYSPDALDTPTHILVLVFRLGEWWVYRLLHHGGPHTRHGA